MTVKLPLRALGCPPADRQVLTASSVKILIQPCEAVNSSGVHHAQTNPVSRNPCIVPQPNLTAQLGGSEVGWTPKAAAAVVNPLRGARKPRWRPV